MADVDGHHPESRTLDFRTIHVLNNHLGVILGFLDLVLDDTRDDDPRKRDLLEIRQAAVSAVALLGGNHGAA